MELLVLPDRERAELAQAARLAPGQAAGGQVLSWGELERALVAALPWGRRPIDALGVRLLLQGLTEGWQREPGFLGALASTLAETRRGLCKPAELLRAARGLPGPHGARLLGMFTLLGRYQRALDERQLHDPEGGLRGAVGGRAAPRAPLPEPLAAARTVIFQDVLEWPPARVALVTALADRFEAEQ